MAGIYSSFMSPLSGFSDITWTHWVLYIPDEKEAMTTMNITGQIKSHRLVLGLWLTLVVSPLYGWELFTHAGINLPFEFQTTDPWYMSIDNQEDWTEFWLGMIPPELDPDSALWTVPGIDFTRYRVLAAGLGEVSHGGYSIKVSVSMSGPDRLVNAHALIPGSGCVTTANINYPTTAILIPETGREPVISFQTSVLDCE